MNQAEKTRNAEIKQRLKAGETYAQVAASLGMPEYDVENVWFGRKTGPNGYGPNGPGGCEN
jgi:hypothetical protein